MIDCENNSESADAVFVDTADDTVDVLLTTTQCALKDVKCVNDDDDKSSDGNLKLFYNIKYDAIYRKKFVLSLSVFWSYVTLGWVVLQIGTALPDLQTLVDIDLDSASWLFTTWSLGFLTGSLFCGFLFDRCNRLVIMCVCAMGAAVCSACLPYSGSFPVVLVLRVMTGIFCGGTDTGANTIVPSIWGVKGGPYMQALYLSYTLGGIVVPFGTKPFMSPHRGITSSAHMTMSSSPNTSYNKDHNNPLSEELKQTYYLNVTQSVYDESPEEYSESHIHYALIVTSGILVVSAIPYVLMALAGGYDQRRTCFSEAGHDSDLDREETSLQAMIVVKKTAKTSGKRKWIVLMCVFGVSFFYSATEDSLGDFLVTFCIDYLEWDNVSSVTLLSLYWVASCVGGLSGILLVRILRTNRLLFIAHIGWAVTFLVSLLASLYKIHLMVWIFMPTSGFFMVLIMPAVISWTEEHVCDVTGCVSAMIMISVGCGLAANPKFIGHMMESYSYVSFLFILFVESVLSICFYAIGYIVRFAFLPNTSNEIHQPKV